MVKKKRKKKQGFFKASLTTGLVAGGGVAGLSALPPNQISPNVATGFGRASTAFPTLGRLKATEITIKASSKLVKTTKKLGKKPKRKK